MRGKYWVVGPLLPALVLIGVACSSAAPTESPTLADMGTPTPAITQPAPGRIEESTPDSTPQPTFTSIPTPTPTTTSTRDIETTSRSVVEAPIGEDPLEQYDPSAMMEAALDYIFLSMEVDPSLIARMGESGDATFVPVLLDLLFFLQGAFPQEDVTDAIRESLIKLTGEDYGIFGWPDWFEWVGAHPELHAPVGYASWKGRLLSLIDPEFTLFFHEGVKTRIRLEEIAWGGVLKDGIPDLIDPPLITADKATYLNPDDRVFGVSINGQHRAYPLRIMNPHEMANDVVGGEPIALAY